MVTYKTLSHYYSLKVFLVVFGFVVVFVENYMKHS